MMRGAVAPEGPMTYNSTWDKFLQFLFSIHEWPGFGSERPNFGSQRPDLRFERCNLMSERLDLGTEKSYLGPY